VRYNYAERWQCISDRRVGRPVVMEDGLSALDGIEISGTGYVIHKLIVEMS
jgi:hypothetical protein